MKVTYNWIKDFVDIALSPQELADKLTMAGLEVKSIEQFQGDYVFEIEITSNRPDWLSVIGIAREVAAVTGKNLKQIKVVRNLGFTVRKNEERCAVVIEDREACPFYSGRVIRNVKIGPSPEWMAKRLQAIGLRSINNIVDITNYVLFTTGQPLHAFDLDEIYGHHATKSSGLQSKIIVRRAANGEEIITIDGIKRKLSPEILVIADEKNPIAIAGIMGGKDSEVNEFTRNILLESAYFSPLAIRKASRRLGLSSDSSYRFERSADKSRIVDSSNLAAALILENTAGEIGRLYSAGSEKKAKKVITFNASSINTLLGIEVAFTKVKSILRTLGLRIISQKKKVLKIEVPDFRQDIKSEIDLIEEICRIAGYENIPLTLPAIKPSGIIQDSLLAIQERIRALLTGLGCNEVISYSLLSEESIKKIRFPFEGICRLESPLSAEQEILQPTLLAGLLDTLRINCELGNKPGAFFEIGNCFHRDRERSVLGIVVENTGLLDFKGIAESIFTVLGITQYTFSPCARPFLKEGQSAAWLALGEEIGTIGRVKDEVVREYKIDSAAVLALEIDLGKLKPYVNFRKTFKALPKYPSVVRDVSMLLDEGIPYQKILDTLNTSGVENLEIVRYKDVYRSDAIGRGKKSLTISIEFRSPEKTLTDSEVNAYLDTIMKRLT